MSSSSEAQIPLFTPSPMPDGPSRAIERTLWSRGYEHVAGLDEAGRGCLAGPVVAASVILPRNETIKDLDDSKTLSSTQRNRLFDEIHERAVAVGTGMCSPQEIDELNILWAAMEAMRRAASTLTPAPDYLLIDGNRCFPDSPWPFKTVVKGDRRSLAIAAASVIAKVTRDRLMHELDDDFPAYGWRTNVGYPTKAHYAALAQHGPTAHHRRSFKLRR